MPRLRPISAELAAPTTRSRMDRDLEQYGHILPGTGITGHAPTIQEGARALDAGITGGRVRQSEPRVRAAEEE